MGGGRWFSGQHTYLCRLVLWLSILSMNLKWKTCSLTDGYLDLSVTEVFSSLYFLTTEHLLSPGDNLVMFYNILFMHYDLDGMP